MCFQSFKSNLLKFEKCLISVKEIHQSQEPQEFWDLFELNERYSKPQLNSNFYSKNIEWNPWFCYLNEDPTSNVTKSSRSKQSLYSYAEENDKKNKCVLFVYPQFQEPFYFFDLDDLQNDGYALLVDPLKKVLFLNNS
jgi:hypothetical protein